MSIHNMTNAQLFLYLVIRLSRDSLGLKGASGVNDDGSVVHIAIDKNNKSKTAVWNMSHLVEEITPLSFGIALAATKIKLQQLAEELDVYSD